MSPTTRLAPRLAVARIKMRSGAAWLDVLAVVSFALSTLIALTVAGGIWMFKTLNDERPARIIRAIGEHNADAMLTYYLLSVVAGALLVIPIFALGSSAARLGAQARARRLATLRLIGVTGSQTVRMALVETAAQWLIGAVAGIFVVALIIMWFADSADARKEAAKEEEARARLENFDPMADGFPVPPLPGQKLPPSPRASRVVNAVMEETND